MCAKHVYRNIPLLISPYALFTSFHILFSFHIPLSSCGIRDPSWAEVRHFVKFLDIQLQSCEASVFCNRKFVGDVMAGLKGFVVRFMIRMSQVRLIWVPPKISTLRPSTPRMSTLKMSTPKMSTSQNVNSQNVNSKNYS